MSDIYLSPVQYNNIPHFDRQAHSVSPDTLLEIGRIFVKHGMHQLARAFLLHRHDDLETGHAMIHSTTDPSHEVCQMKPVSQFHRKLSPRSLRFDHDRSLCEVDYQQESRPVNLKPEFLEELSEFICGHELEDLIGISNLSDSHGCWIEYLHPDGRGTIAHRVHEHDQEWTGATVATEWAFHEDNGLIRYMATRKCEPPPEGGGHVRK